VNAGGQALLGGDPAEQRYQLPTFGVGETRAELGLMLGRTTASALLHLVGRRHPEVAAGAWRQIAYR